LPQKGQKKINNGGSKERKRNNIALKEKKKKENLLEDVNPLFKHLTTESGAEVPISLSLFNWRRRQQLIPEKESYYARKKRKASILSRGKWTRGKGKDMDAILPAGIDTALLSWEQARSSAMIHTQPATLEPPRKRYSDSTYGLWCSRLINCLQGNGREMARHEFFYSDIDKAWFNFSEFHKELAEMGVPRNARLTRSEWSLLRSRMKNRPRRFSKKFIASQYEQLQSYRQLVRKIQNDLASEELKNDFSYEVLAPIKAGATVTAYNSRAKILHRGTVLTHKHDTYLVQFERKDLGCEYCPDIEVASHGIPEILKPACDITIGIPVIESQNNTPGRYGSLPYGTSYGPLIGDGKAVNKGDISSSALLSKAKLYEKVAERETLVKLICMINVALKRKDMIMDTIKLCHEKFKRAKFVHGAHALLSDRSCEVFKDYYDLLQINLRLNEEALETALVYLQIMYGKAYIGDPINSPSSANDLNVKLRVNHSFDIGKNWSSSLLSGSAKVGSAIARQMESNSVDISLEPLIIENVTGYRKQVLQHRMASALGLLQITDHIGVIANDKHGSMPHAVAPDHQTVTNLLQNTIEVLQPLKIPSLPQNVMNILPSSNSGFKALSDAVKMLLIEIAVST